MTTELSQADIMAAMSAGQFRSKPPSSTFLHSDIDTSALTQEAEGSKTNSRKIYCFREGCGSVVLQKGAALYVESSSTIVRPQPSMRSCVKLMISSLMTHHHLSHLQQTHHMDSGTSPILIHLTISDSQDPIRHLLLPSLRTYQGMMGK